MPTKKKVSKPKEEKKPIKKPKVEKELVCLTCIRMNRVADIRDGVCLTCKRGNRRQEVIEA